MLAPKIKDWDAFQKRAEQRRRFNAWCKEKGYFPHTKYFEAWLAALDLS